MHRWPQGKVIRTICGLLTLIIALDLGYNGAWAQLGPYFSDEESPLRQLIVGCAFGVLALGALIAGIVAIGFHKRAVDFLIEVEAEMTRVTWPAGRDLVRSTIFIAIMIVALSAGILLVDYVNKNILDSLMKVNSVMTTMRWYVIKAVSGRENKVRDTILSTLRVKGLEPLVGQMLVPAERVTEVKRGKKVSSERKLYPGYIYIEMDPKASVLEAINEIDGVTGFLGADPRQPDALTNDEAERIVKIATAQSTDEQRAAIVQVPFKIDDRVKVKEGTFAGMEGIVAEINAQKGELRVLITVFGRQTPVWLEVWQVEAAV